MVKRFDVYWVNLDPTTGAEMKKIRPAVVISPDEMNDTLKTVIIAPLTSTIRKYPFRVNVKISEKSSQVALDQMRSIDSSRIKTKIGSLTQKEQTSLLNTLLEMFN